MLLFWLTESLNDAILISDNSEIGETTADSETSKPAPISETSEPVAKKIDVGQAKKIPENTMWICNFRNH